MVTILKKLVFMVLNKHNYAFNQLWGLTHSSSYSKKKPQTKTKLFGF